MGKLDGRVAFITGAGRGQGRSHAVRLAEDGADILAVDICAPIDTVPYPLASDADLAETARLVRAAGRRVATCRADVRDRAALETAVKSGVDELGSIDIVVANAGIAPQGSSADPSDIMRDIIDINLIGAWNTASVAAPAMLDRGQGGVIILTSSTQGLSGRGGDGSAAAAGYTASKHGVVGLMRSLANWLSPHGIRVNAVNPTAVATPMAQNDAITAWLTSRPSHDAGIDGNLMPVPMIEPSDVSNLVAFLASDEARYITGVALPVDAGFGVK